MDRAVCPIMRQVTAICKTLGHSKFFGCTPLFGANKRKSVVDMTNCGGSGAICRDLQTPGARGMERRGAEIATTLPHFTAEKIQNGLAPSAGSCNQLGLKRYVEHMGDKTQRSAHHPGSVVTC